jgi:hypothetical protein
VYGHVRAVGLKIVKQEHNRTEQLSVKHLVKCQVVLMEDKHITVKCYNAFA